MSKYAVVEIFSTFQGEGRWSGRPAVFLRFAGCNMWNGRPEDRAQGQGACAMWCDTNFAKGKSIELEELLDRVRVAWGDSPRGVADGDAPMVVISGGEPTLQIDEPLIRALKADGYYVAIETNGTIDNPALKLIDHVCVSPKRGSTLAVFQAEELKVVIPGGVPGAPPEHQWSHAELNELATAGMWGELYVQPQDVTDVTAVEQTHLHQIRRGLLPGEVPSGTALYEGNVQACLDFIKASPGWRLSLQSHKYIGVR